MCPGTSLVSLGPTLVALRTLFLLPTWSTADPFPRPVLEGLVLLALLALSFVAGLLLRRSRPPRAHPSDSSRDFPAS